MHKNWLLDVLRENESKSTVSFEQTMQRKLGKHLSELFRVSNVVRQGWVLSPYLFAAHLDQWFSNFHE